MVSKFATIAKQIPNRLSLITYTNELENMQPSFVVFQLVDSLPSIVLVCTQILWQRIARNSQSIIHKSDAYYIIFATGLKLLHKSVAQTESFNLD